VNKFDASYYEVLRGRIRGVLIAMGSNLPTPTGNFVVELLDANECGEALEVLTEVLAESGVPVADSVIQDITDLFKAMDLNPDAVGRLTTVDAHARRLDP
jgi:hypothetical protein